MVRLASNSTCLGLVEPLLEPPQKIHRAEILNKIMAYIDKKITYEHDDNGKNKKFAYKPNTVSNGAGHVGLEPTTSTSEVRRSYKSAFKQ